MIFKSGYLLKTDRIALRLPKMSDYKNWEALRLSSSEFLAPWEPRRYDEQIGHQSFRERVKWSKLSKEKGTALALFIFRLSDQSLIGAVTLDGIKRGPSQSATIGYWLGKDFVGNGFMSEALKLVVTHAFTELDLSRIEAATLKENQPSRKLLERNGFRYEGVAQSYMQINGRWRPHVLYANLRRDRLGQTDIGIF